MNTCFNILAQASFQSSGFQSFTDRNPSHYAKFLWKFDGFDERSGRS
jgi:hypothetical protein